MRLLKKILLGFAFLVFAVLMLPGIIRPPAETALKETSAVKDLADGLIAALIEYRDIHGQFPDGGPGEIMAALRAETDTDKAIFNPPPESLNERGELLDPWGTPFRITIDYKRGIPKIQSAGPNLIFEEKGRHHTHGDDYYSSP